MKSMDYKAVEDMMHTNLYAFFTTAGYDAQYTGELPWSEAVYNDPSTLPDYFFYVLEETIDLYEEEELGWEALENNIITLIALGIKWGYF